MMIRILSLAVLTGLALPTAVDAQSIVQHPGVTFISDVTPDGSIVVGTGSGGGFYWRWRVDPAPTYIGGNCASGVSDDGTVIVGDITDPILNAEVAARWTQATGWESLGYLPSALSCPSRSNSYDVSGDGSTVVGLSWDGCSGRGFRWTDATGMQELLNLGNGQNRASAISGDGSAIGGFAQGSFSRTPAYWNPDTTGSLLDINDLGEVYSFNEDGATSVGTRYFGSGSFYSAYVRDAATGTLTNLGALNPSQMAGIATDISEDGNTIVGFDSFQLSREAWVWTASDGIVSLEDRLTALGVSGLPSTIYTCSAVSDDGLVVVGSATPGFGSGFIADLDPNGGGWVNVGGGTIGINGIPLLDGSGPLMGGTPVGMQLTQARESTLTVAWVSLNPTPVNVLDGTVHTLPYINQFLFNTDAAGEINLNTTWPVGVPSGTQAWFQFLIADSSSIHDIVLSNALRATTP